MAQPGRLRVARSPGRIEGIALAGGMPPGLPGHRHRATARPCTTTPTATCLAKGRPAAHRLPAPRPPAATPPTSPAPCPWAAASTPGRRPIYEIVLAVQLTAIAMITPGVSYTDIHLKTGRGPGRRPQGPRPDEGRHAPRPWRPAPTPCSSRTASAT
ncbi:MAG: hypothetical protein MZV70_66680 [Desulfobacterales bacterium]|nr:hypothetical protein [Desulfobacterales bacterium]